MGEINAGMAVRILSNTSQDKVFRCNDGKVFNNLEELESGLKNMNAETFSYHVNNEKNDFSNWIYDVLGDVHLADSIRKIKNKHAIVKKVRKHLAELKRAAKS